MRNWINLVENKSINTVLYHGSHATFDKFEAGHRNGWSKPRMGFYFTDDQEVVEEYFGKAQAFHVRLNNAANFEYGQGSDIVLAAIERNNTLVDDLKAVEERYGEDTANSLLAHRFASMGFLQSDTFVSTLIEMGYDGMIFDDLMSGTPFTSYVAFNADQITCAV